VTNNIALVKHRLVDSINGSAFQFVLEQVSIGFKGILPTLREFCILAPMVSCWSANTNRSASRRDAFTRGQFG